MITIYNNKFYVAKEVEEGVHELSKLKEPFKKFKLPSYKIEEATLIFFIDQDPHESAKAIDTVIIPYVINAVARVLMHGYPAQDRPLQATNNNGDTVSWTTLSCDNHIWVVKYLDGLLDEWSKRSNNPREQHSIHVIHRWISSNPIKRTHVSLRPFPMEDLPIDFQILGNVTQSYKDYYECLALNSGI